MNILIPIAAIAAIAYSFSSPKKKTTPSIKGPYLSEDCLWLCNDSVLGFDISKEIIQHSKTMDKAIVKLGNNVSITSLANEVFNTYISKTKCRLKYEEITPVDSFTVRYLWINHLITSAYYLGLKNVILDQQVAEWLYVEFPKELVRLQLMVIGNYQLDLMKLKFSSLTDEALNSALLIMFTLVPELRKLNAELLTSIVIITLSQTLTVIKQENCIKVTNLFFADYTSLAGQSDPMFKSQFERIFKAVITLNPKS